MKKKNIILFNSYFPFYFFQYLTNFDIDSFRDIVLPSMWIANLLRKYVAFSVGYLQPRNLVKEYRWFSLCRNVENVPEL